MKRYDERDHMFSRMNYTVEGEQYEDFYKRRPELKEVDDGLRSMPELGEPGSVTFNEFNSPIVTANFKFLGDIKKYSEGPVAEEKTSLEGIDISGKIKEIGKAYGADLIGICEIPKEYYYSNRGREEAHYGDPVEKTHKYGIVFAVELKKDFIMRAPQVPEAIAAVKGYTDAAMVGMILSYYIRELGYDARNHMDGNYLLIAPMVGAKAGLGEIGRNGLLVTREFGPRVRLGVVTTDMPLDCDEAVDFNLQRFCERCKVCAFTCPGKSIPKGDKVAIHGDMRWKIDMEECYKRWRSLGTDCGICLCNCPFSMGIEGDTIAKLKSDDVIDAVVEEYKAKYGPRPIIREKLDIEK